MNKLFLMLILLCCIPISYAIVDIEGETHDFTQNTFLNTEIINDKIYLSDGYTNGYSTSPIYDLYTNKQLDEIISDYSINFLPYRNVNHPLFNTEHLAVQYEFNELGLSEFTEHTETNYNLIVNGSYNYYDNNIDITDGNKLYTNITNINFSNGLTFVTYFKINNLVDEDYLIELIADDDTRYWCRARYTNRIRCNFDGAVDTGTVTPFISEWAVFTGIIDPFTLSYQVYMDETLILNDSISASMNINLTELYFLSSKDTTVTFEANAQNFYVFEEVFNLTQITNINSIMKDEIQLSYRTCNDEYCNGESFTTIPNMQSINYKENNLGVFDISSSDVNQYFQYKTTLYKYSDNMSYYIEDFSVTDNLGEETIPEVSIGGYEKFGGNNQDFIGGLGVFSHPDFDYELKTRAFANLDYVPLVKDLNNDNINEIFIIDGTDVKIYHYSTLEPITSISTSLTNPIKMSTENLESDNLIVCDSSSCEIYSMNVDNSFDLIIKHEFGITTLNDQFNFECDEDYCVFSYPSISGRYGYLRVLAFNEFNYSVITTLETEGNQVNQYYSRFCSPIVDYMSAIDHDNDGVTEYVFSSILEEEYVLGTDRIFIKSVYVNDSAFPNANTVIEKYDYSHIVYNSNNMYNGNFDCEDFDIKRKLSSPLVSDSDSFETNGDEIAFGLQVNANEFKIYQLKSDLDFIQYFPNLFNADGVLLSNPAIFDIFEDSNTDDICIMGYDIVDDMLDLLCGSTEVSFFLGTSKSDEFKIDLDEFLINNFTVTEDFFMSIHNVDMLQQTDQHNSNEILTPYGVLEIDYDYANELDITWENPINQEMFLLPIDVEGVGKIDLIGLSTNQLFYFDDKLSNQPPTISKDNGIEFNPCLTEKTVDFNSSLEVMVRPVDSNGNEISSKIELYADSSNEIDSGWSNFYVSGTQIRFGEGLDVDVPLIFDKITATGVMRISLRDNFDITQITSYDFPFTVIYNGSTTYNDGCITTYEDIQEIIDISEGTIPDTTNDFIPTSMNYNNNTMVNSTRQLGGLFGFSELMVIFILMCVSALVPWFLIRDNNTHAFAVMIFLLTIELVGATWLKIMPLGITLSIFLISIGLTIPLLSRFFIGGSTE